MMYRDSLHCVQFQILTDTAYCPTRAHRTDAGLDLYADESATIHPAQVTTIGTGVAVAIPRGYAGLIWPRSGLAVKGGVDVLAGVIDSGYRGEIKVALTTVSDPVRVSPGDRIAQLVIQRVESCDPVIVRELPEAPRGDSGFGSSGR